MLIKILASGFGTHLNGFKREVLFSSETNKI